MPNAISYTVAGAAFRRDWQSLKRSVTLLVEAESHLAGIKASESLRHAKSAQERAENHAQSARNNYEMALRRLHGTVTGNYIPYHSSLESTSD